MPRNPDPSIPTWRGINKPRLDAQTRVVDWPQLMTAKEVAIALGIGYNGAIALQKSGALPWIQGTNRRRLTPKAAVLEYLVRGSEPIYDAARRYSQATAVGQ